jgi:hypothetical protein
MIFVVASTRRIRFDADHYRIGSPHRIILSQGVRSAIEVRGPFTHDLGRGLV